jgi:hypothetical protein
MRRQEVGENCIVRSFITCIILCVVLYGWETCLLHYGEMFENRVLRIFGLKSNEVIGARREPHNEELHSMCCFIRKSRRNHINRTN